jgi:HPt (histidine-containing phosphotransfer) domain-containing protein
MRPPVDVPRLQECSDGTADGVRTLVDIFLSDVEETIRALSTAVDGGRVADIGRLAHRAGGASGACGAAHLAELLLALEELAQGGHVDGSATLMREVDDELSRVATFLERYVDNVGERP